MQRAELEIRAKDGRLLMVTVVGPEDGAHVFLLHGTPGVRDLYGPNIEDGARRGLRYILYSRPGYEGSDRQPGRSVADCAADIAAIADALGVGTFYVIGESGGGPHAFAVAALLPWRVLAVATIASLVPFDAQGLSWFKEGNRAEYAAVLAGDEALRKYLEREVEALSQVQTKEQLLAVLAKHLCAADRAMLGMDFGNYVLANWRRIGKQGIWGWFDDDKAHVADWGFDLDRVICPVTVWQGGVDDIVPPAHGEWFAEHLPQARLHLFPEDGHISICRRYDAILDALIASGSSTRT